MKKIKCLKTITLFEILLNTVMFVLLLTGIVANLYDFSAQIFFSIGVVHISSMVLHWFAWKQLPTTLNARIIFNVWVIGSFTLTFLFYYFLGEMVIIMLFLLSVFAMMWFVYYCMLLFAEFKYLKRKRDLYEKRELIHF